MKKVKQIQAISAATGEVLHTASTFEAAAGWAIDTGKADCRGRIAAHRTVITNIKNCIMQPTLYTQFYGMKWSCIETTLEE